MPNDAKYGIDTNVMGSLLAIKLRTLRSLIAQQ